MSNEQNGFESKMARLKEIVTRLEQEDLPLEEGVALFQEGSRLARQCRNHLREAEHRVRQYTRAGLEDVEDWEQEHGTDEPSDDEDHA
jgi:exodeoxyribonuclease VII small subunit